MADRYQDRAYGHGRGGDHQHGSDRGDNDPLAELARLIGQTDPFGKSGGQASPRPAPPRQELRRQDLRPDYYGEQDYALPAAEPEPPPAPSGPPAWIQRANIRREPPREAPREALRETPRDYPRALPPEAEGDDYPNAVHPLHRYAQQPQSPPPLPDDDYDEQAAYEPQAYQQPSHQPQGHQHQGHQHQGYQQQAYQQGAYQQDQDPQAYAEAEPEPDPSRYDDALYGQLENGVQDFLRDPAYPDDPYAYQGEYDEELEEPQKRRGLPFKVAAVLALGVFGVAAAYGYHSFFGTTRSGEIPIIKADNSPTKVVPQQADASTKVPDRMVSGDGTEKMVPREEQPVDINSRSVGPRVVFPQPSQNANPPPVGSVAPPAGSDPAQAANNGTMPNSEPRKVKIFTVKGDQPDPSAVPVTAPPATAPPAAAAKNTKAARTPPTQANASANAPMSLSPQGQPVDTGTQVAATNPTQVAPSAPASGGGGYLVSIASQPTEADAQGAFRSMQSKYPAVLGSQSPVIARANTKNGAVMYRVGVSFATHDEAAQFCKNYESAGGQCWVVKN